MSKILKEKQDVISEAKIYLKEKEKVVRDKYKSKPSKSDIKEFELYESVKKENSNGLSINDKSYKFVLSVLVFALLTNVTIITELFFQEELMPKIILLAFVLVLIILFLTFIVAICYLTDKMFLLEKYHDLKLSEYNLPEVLNYKLKKELNKNIKNAKELKYLLKSYNCK